MIKRLPHYIFIKQHPKFLLFKSEELLFYNKMMFSVFNDILLSFEKSNEVTFLGTEKDNECDSFTIPLDDYHELVKKLYEGNSNNSLRMLEPSPYLHLCSINYCIEYFGDSLLDLGIIGCSEVIYKCIVEKINSLSLTHVIWNSSSGYFEYLKPRLDNDEFANFALTFSKNYPTG